MSKQIKRGQYEKRLRIAVRFDGARLTLLDGSPLPTITKDAVCELVLRPELLQNPEDRDRFVRDEVFSILSQGSSVLLGVSPHSVADPEAPGLICNPQEIGVQTEYWLVEIRLQDDLRIRIRGDQEAKLEPCECRIPALKRDVSSVNHAFTVISETYENKTPVAHRQCLPTRLHAGWSEALENVGRASHQRDHTVPSEEAGLLRKRTQDLAH